MKRRILKTLTLFMIIMSVAPYAGVFANQANIDSSFNTGVPTWFNGSIYSLTTQNNGKIIVGGDFTTYKWTVANDITRLNADWSKDPSFNIWSWFDNYVSIVSVQNNGKIIVGGNFTTYNWVTANHIIRLNTDWSRDSSFNIWDWFDNWVLSIKIQNDGKILVGWIFTSYNWTPTNYIVRLNADWSRDSSFNIWDWFDTSVNSIAVQNNGKILVGWVFTSYNWATANHIIRLNTDWSRDSSFDIWGWFDNYVQSIWIQNDGKIIVGWLFQSYSGPGQWYCGDPQYTNQASCENEHVCSDGVSLDQASCEKYVCSDGSSLDQTSCENEGYSWYQNWTWDRINTWNNFSSVNGIIRLNTDWSVDTSFIIWDWFHNDWPDTIINAIGIQNNGKILLGGSFTSYNWVTANHIICLNADWSRDSSFNIWDWFNNSVSSLIIKNDGKILVGGWFSTYKWLGTNAIARLNGNWSRDSSFDIWNWLNSFVQSIGIQNDGKILIGGGFSSYNWILTNRLIRLNANWVTDSSFIIWSWFNESISDIGIQSNGKILIGGGFSSYNWIPTSYIVRLNSDWSRDSSFNIWSWFDNSVESIGIQSDGKIIVGGTFYSYNWVQANYIIRLNTDWSRDSSFNIWSWFDNSVESIGIQSDGKIILWGRFDTYNWVQANRIIRLNTDWSRDDSFNSPISLYQGISNITLQNDGKILIGGGASIGVIRLNTDWSRDSSFNIWSWFGIYVTSIAVQNNGKILVGGGLWLNSIIRLNADWSKDPSFNIWDWFNNPVETMAIQNNGKIIVGGDFTSFNWVPAWYLTSLYGDSNIVILPNSTNTTTVNDEFTSKWYTQSNGDFIWSTAISLIDTNGSIPKSLSIKNDDITLAIPADTQFKKADNVTNYSGIISAPSSKAISSVNDEQVLSAFKVGSSSESVKLVWWEATLLAPAPGETIWDTVQIYYSDDNGVTRYPQSVATVINYNWQPYTQFTTNHFTDFAVTLPPIQWWWSFTWSFVINNDAVSTTSSGVTLYISTTPSANQMRFSNDNLTRSNREPYVTTTVWMLPWTYWPTTVYAQFDIDGDWTGDITTNDSINYTAPWWWGSHGSSTWNLRLQIITSSWSCSYGTSLYIGSHQSQYTAYDMTGSNFSSSFSCIDTEWLSDWTMTMQATTDLSDGAQTISKDNVSLIASPNYVSAGACTTGTNQDSWISIGSTPGTILWKFSGQWDICTITSDTVNLAVHIPASQAVGLYTGTLTLNMPF